MVDFVGQKRAFWICVMMFVVCVPVAIVYALIRDDYYQSLTVWIAVSAVAFVAFVPNWPWLNMNTPKWRDDESETDPKKAVKRKTK